MMCQRLKDEVRGMSDGGYAIDYVGHDRLETRHEHSNSQTEDWITRCSKDGSSFSISH